jgi:hydrogenase maturation factor
VRPGKLPPDWLRRHAFAHLGVRRADVLVHAAIGEDCAVVDFGDEVCVLTTDPITGATQRAGWYAVHVGCNDLAACGARPVGVLVTLLASEQETAESLAAVMADVAAAARELGIEVLGGHSEVTPGLPQTIVVATAMGRAPRTQYVTSAGARPGDALLLTKSAGLEGTAILATDLSDRLAGRVPADVLERARAFIEQLSVVPEGLAAAAAGAHALHDATEGGVVGAVAELTEAAGVGVELWADVVPLAAETRAICAALAVDPLRLISSGALLIACADGPAMVAHLAARGIPAAIIGRLLPHAEGRWLVASTGRQPLAPPDRDELWRVLEQR